jgi:hypothetical protein
MSQYPYNPELGPERLHPVGQRHNEVVDAVDLFEDTYRRLNGGVLPADITEGPSAVAPVDNPATSPENVLDFPQNQPTNPDLSAAREALDEVWGQQDAA